MFSYFFGKKDQKESPMRPMTPIVSVVTKELKSEERKRKHRVTSDQNVYVVVNTNSQQPIGVFDTLDVAKREGQKVSYYSCAIYSLTLNGKCNYLQNPVFEN